MTGKLLDIELHSGERLRVTVFPAPQSADITPLATLHLGRRRAVLDLRSAAELRTALTTFIDGHDDDEPTEPSVTTARAD